MRDNRAPDHHVSYQSETSTSGLLLSAVVTIVNRGNPRTPLGQPKGYLFGVDYLEPNKITKRELAKYRAEYRIPWPTKSLINPKDDEVVFFTDILQHWLKQLTSSQSDIWKIEQVKLKVPAVERIYLDFLCTENLLKACLADLVEMTDARKSTEAKKMSESSKRCLLVGVKEKKQWQQLARASAQMTEADLENQTLAKRLKQLDAELVSKRGLEAESVPKRGVEVELVPKVTGKRPTFVELDAEPVSKRGRSSERPRAILAVKDEEGLA
ncbi:unnamed protein product [Prunus brigantina]